MRKVKQYYGMLPFVPNMYICIYIDTDIHKIAVVVELGARNEKQTYYTLHVTTLLPYYWELCCLLKNLNLLS